MNAVVAVVAAQPGSRIAKTQDMYLLGNVQNLYHSTKEIVLGCEKKLSFHKQTKKTLDFFGSFNFFVNFVYFAILTIGWKKTSAAANSVNYLHC